MSGYGKPPKENVHALPLFRKSDPDTSKQAATHVRIRLAKLHANIIAQLEQYIYYEGTQPTARELGIWMNVEAWRRMGEMEKKGMVIRGEPRKCTVTGRNAATWRLPLTRYISLAPSSALHWGAAIPCVDGDGGGGSS